MRRAFLLTLFLLASCHQPKTAPEPADHKIKALADRLGWYSDSLPLLRFDPPPIYALWRAEVEHCSGHERAGWPKLFIAPVEHFNGTHLAFYVYKQNAIVFALGSESAPWIVRHEILHFLLPPSHEHDPEYFGEGTRCGALVNLPSP